MTVLGHTYRAELWKVEEHEDQLHFELRAAAAAKLNKFTRHVAGGGSEYVYVEDEKLRFANHENTSRFYDAPDHNVVGRDLDEAELSAIIERIKYPRLCKKTAFAMHLGLTVPKLKKLLTPECYESVCENPYYENTFTEYIVVEKALAEAEKHGITARIPVAQERWTEEDYCGQRW